MHKKDREALQKISESYIFKALGLGFIILLLLIPLGMIGGLVDERQSTAKKAEQEIMRSWGEELFEAGPMISIPGIRTITTRTQTEKEGEKISTREENFWLVVTPRELNIKTDLKTEVRSYGIFSVPLFYGQLNLSGTFDTRDAIRSVAANERIFLDRAELGILLSSQKGIRKITNANWNNRQLFFQPLSYQGISAALPALTEHRSNFDISVDMQGGQSVRFLPVAQDTQVMVSSDWSSPSFKGAFLPVSRDVAEKSFTAQWNISYLSRNIPLFWKSSASLSGELDKYKSTSSFGVDFFRQINTYSLNTRAVKYAILFLVVPFLALFIMEFFAKKRIHPVPYMLAGIGNIIFYLLLLSFSEQMPFFLAYFISGTSVAAMMTLYSRALLGSWDKSWYMALVMGLSYIMLYAVLNAESYALLIGSIGAFIVTALIMYLTRKLDWYGGK